MNHYNKPKTRQVKVEIKQLALSTPRDIVMYDWRKDKTLTEAIDFYSKHLEEQDIEIFERDKNILWTESGIHIALYDSGLEQPAVRAPKNPVPAHPEPAL